ncbi:unnamed protein product, partial [Prunus brigantina]
IPNVLSARFTDSGGRLFTIRPYVNLRHGLPSNQPSRQSDSDRLPQNFCQNLSEHVSISEDTPTSPTSKLKSLLVTNFGIGVPSASTTPISLPQFGSSPCSNLRTSRKKVTPVLNHQHTCKLA